MRVRRTKLMRHAGPYKVVSRVVGEVAVRREGAVRLRPEVQRFAELMEWKLRGVDSLADMTEWELWVAVMARLHRSCDLDEALEESLVVAALAAYAYSKVAQRVHAQDPGGEL